MKNMISIVLLAGLIFTTISCHKKHSDKAELETTNSYFTYDGERYELKDGEIGSFYVPDMIESRFFSIALYTVEISGLISEGADLPTDKRLSIFNITLFSDTESETKAKVGEYVVDSLNQEHLDFTVDNDISLFLNNYVAEDGMISSDEHEDILIESGTVDYKGKEDGKYEMDFDFTMDNGKTFKGHYEGSLVEFFE